MRVLALVSADFGELSYAKYFLSGLSSVPAPTLMVPTTLGQPEACDPQSNLRHYSALADILAVVEELRPQVVLFFSGYLLTIGPRFSLFNALWLLHQLRRRNIPLVTSDPFIGLLRTPWALQFDAVLPSSTGFLAGFAARLAHWKLSFRGYVMYLRLKPVLHIYPMPLANRVAAKPGHQCSFYNPLVLSGQVAMSADHFQAPLWFFVLSAIDLQYQRKVHGEGFYAQIAGRLQDAVRCGAKVVLLAPAEMLERLRGLLPADFPAQLMDHCEHLNYLRLLQRAQHLFLWNYYSFSVLHRILSQQAVFFFAEGHMVSILPALQEEGIRTFYGGWRPPLLRLDDPLAPVKLDPLAQQTCQNFAKIKLRMAQGISPQAVLERAVGATDGL